MTRCSTVPEFSLAEKQDEINLRWVRGRISNQIWSDQEEANLELFTEVLDMLAGLSQKDIDSLHRPVSLVLEEL